MKKWLNLLAVAVLAGIWWRFGITDLAAAFARFSPAMAAIYLIISTVVILGYCLRWSSVTHALGARPPFARLLAARLAGDAVGSLVPSAKLAGEPVRAALVHTGGLAGPQAGAGVAIDRILELIGNMLCVIAYVAVFSFTHAFGPSNHAYMVLGAAMLFLLAAMMLPLVMLWRGGRPLAFLYGPLAQRTVPKLAGWLDALREMENHLRTFFQDHPRTFLWGIVGSLAVEALVIGEYYFLLAAFGIDLDLPMLLMVLLGTGLAHAVPTPASLGALEATQVTVFALAAGHPETGFVVGVVMRLHETLRITVGLIALSLQGVSLARLRLLRATEKVVV